MKRNAYTLIELIISITIFTIIIVTVYGVFYMGMKSWRRGQDRRPLYEVRLGLLKIEKELKDSFSFSEIPFKGTHKEISFPLCITDEGKEESYTITYSVHTDEDSGLDELIRRQKSYSEDIDGQREEKLRKLLSSMQLIRFEYAYKSGDPFEDYRWQDTWEGETLPSGVRVSLQMDGTDEVFNKLIFIQEGEFGEQ